MSKISYSMCEKAVKNSLNENKRKEGDKMRQKRYLLLVVFALTALNCERNNAIVVNKNDTLDITWQQTSFDSLKILGLAASPTNSAVYASTCSSPIYRTMNQGETWQSIYPRNVCVNVLAVNTSGVLFALSPAGFSKSVDNGVSWTVSGNLYDFGFSTDLVSIGFRNDSEIFVGSNGGDESVGGLYYSPDTGRTWMATTFPDTLGPRAIVINAQGNLFIGTYRGIFRSMDGGQTWQSANTGIPFTYGPYVNAIAIHPGNGYLFAGMSPKGVFVSTNNGETWQATDIGVDEIEYLVINSKGYVFAANGNYTPTGGVYCSTDLGQSWTKITNGLTNTDILSLTVDIAGFLYVGTRRSGVFRTVKSTIE